MALKPATPQDVQEPAPPLTPEQKRKNAAAYEKQEKAKKKSDTATPINPEFTQEPSKPFVKGGSVRGGGCEQRGKTKGKMV